MFDESHITANLLIEKYWRQIYWRSKNAIVEGARWKGNLKVNPTGFGKS